MSGGSYNYICYKLEEECKGAMYDAEMNDLIVDLCGVLHDLEWWQSCDISEEAYRKTLSAFKKKWFKGDREQRQKEQQPSKDDCLKASYEVIGRYEDEIKDLKAQLDTVVKTMNDRIEAANLHSKELCDRVHKKIDKTIDEQTRMENEITRLKDADIKALESKIDSLADRVWKAEGKTTDASILLAKANDRIKVVDEGLSSLKDEVLNKVEPDIRQLYFEDLPRIDKLETKVSNLEFDTQKLLAEMSKIPKDQEHDFRITCSTEEPRCIDCSYSEENGKSCSAEGCICYSKFTPKEKGD